MVCGETPARSLSRVRSRISAGGVSSMNCTNGSIASEYWTRCGIGMVSFSLICGYVGFVASTRFSISTRATLLSQRVRQGIRGLFHFPDNRPARFANCQCRRTHQGYAPEAPLSSFAGGDALRFPALPCARYRVVPGLRHHNRDEKGGAEADGGEAEERRLAAELIGDKAGHGGAQRRAAADCEAHHPESGRVAAGIARDVRDDQRRQDAKGCRAQSVEQLDQDHRIWVGDGGEQNAAD